jgi:hypothetical protein
MTFCETVCGQEDEYLNAEMPKKGKEGLNGKRGMQHNMQK